MCATVLDPSLRDEPVADQLTNPDTESEPTAKPRKRRRLRVRKARLVLLVVLTSAIVGALAWLLSWQSPVPVREVVVIGAEVESQGAVLAAANIVIGTPLTDIDKDSAVANLEALPGIDAAQLQLQRPWTVAIEVVERFPFAVVANADQWTLIDTHGQPIREVSQRPAKLPELTVAPEQIGSAVAAAVALSDEDRARVKIVSSGEGGITMELRSGATVTWGNPDRNELKAKTLAALLKYNAQGYNVSIPERPAMTGDLDLPKENRVPKPEPTL